MLKLNDIKGLIIYHEPHATAKIGRGNHSVLPSGGKRPLGRLRNYLVPFAVRRDVDGAAVFF
jgi:hypothetical protein